MRSSLLLGIVMAVSVSWACSTHEQESSKLVILISIDTLRADRLGCYGYERDTTPALDKLAASGAVFDNAFAPSSWTVPSHASLLTGLYPASHGMRFPGQRVPDDVPFLASVLAGEGYATAAFVNTPHLDRNRGFDRDFETFAYLPPTDGRLGDAGKISRRATDWILQNRTRPRFLFLHFYDVHSDYRSDARYEQMFVSDYDGIADGSTDQLKAYRTGKVELDERDALHLSDLYDAGIRQFDDDLARFLESLKETDLLDHALIVVTSDHGEEFLDHGGFLHSSTLYRELVRVPLIFKGPGIPGGLRIPQAVSLIDVFPTVTSLLGLNIPMVGEGIDLSSAWGQEEAFVGCRDLFFETDFWLAMNEGAYRRAVQRGRYKLHLDGESEAMELYDIVLDPLERENLADQLPEVVSEYLPAIQRYSSESRISEREIQMSEQTLETLRALGYLE